MKIFSFFFLSFLSFSLFAADYNCYAGRANDTNHKFNFNPQKLSTSSFNFPDSEIKLECSGLDLDEEKYRLMCSIHNMSFGGIAPSASTRDGAEILTLVQVIDEKMYYIACVRSDLPQSKLTSLLPSLET